MMRLAVSPLVARLVLASMIPAQQGQDGAEYPIRPVGAREVGVEDHFWRPRIETNRRVTIPFALGKCEETGRIENFKVAGGVVGPWLVQHQRLRRQ